MRNAAPAPAPTCASRGRPWKAGCRETGTSGLGEGRPKRAGQPAPRGRPIPLGSPRRRAARGGLRGERWSTRARRTTSPRRQLRRAKTDALDARDLARLAAALRPTPVGTPAGGLPRGAPAAGRPRRPPGDAHPGAQPAPRPAAMAGRGGGRAPAPRRADRRVPLGASTGGSPRWRPRSRPCCAGQRVGGVARCA